MCGRGGPSGMHGEEKGESKVAFFGALPRCWLSSAVLRRMKCSTCVIGHLWGCVENSAPQWRQMSERVKGRQGAERRRAGLSREFVVKFSHLNLHDATLDQLHPHAALGFRLAADPPRLQLVPAEAQQRWASRHRRRSDESAKGTSEKGNGDAAARSQQRQSRVTAVRLSVKRTLCCSGAE